MAMTLRKMEQRHAAILGDLPGQLDQVLPETRLNFSHVVSQHILFMFEPVLSLVLGHLQLKHPSF